MKLGEIFSQKSNKESSKVSSSNIPSKNADISRQIRALTPGQTIRGEVMGRNGNEVQIKLSDDMVLEARIDQSIALETGKSITFEVKNNGRSLTLSPLYTNVAADVNVLKALDMAGIPVTERSVLMTSQMMEAGLSVNRQALQQAYHAANAFPESDVSDIVNLSKLELPVTSENLSQMASYRNLTYQLSAASDTLMEMIPNDLNAMLQGDAVGEAANFLREMVGFGFEDGSTSFYNVSGALTNDFATSFLASLENLGLSDEAVQAFQNALADATADGGNVGQFLELMDKLLLQADSLQEDAAAAPTQNGGIAADARADGAWQEAATNQLATEQTMGKAATGAQAEDSAVLQNSFNTPSAATPVQDAWNPTEFGSLENAGTKEAWKQFLKGILGNEEFMNLLKTGLKASWSIDPEDSFSAEEVGALYERMERQLGKIQKSLANGGQSASASFQTASNMSENIHFLQELNQMYAYVQIPLQASNGQAHGDFYVYANRKSLAAADGNFSALLHLDMEHLGPLDVFVSLQKSKVNTNFKVRDEETLDFLEAHMDRLTSRLSKRGYDCAYSMQSVAEEDGESDLGLKPILGSHGASVISQYAFDVRT